MRPRRIDHIDNPDAPGVNSIVPAAAVAVTNDKGRLLLIRRSDNNFYALPGGTQEFGESLVDTAIRECKEETGYEITVVGLVGIYTNPKHRIEYTSNGEVRQEFAIVYSAVLLAGDAMTSIESPEVVWVDPAKIDVLAMTTSQRLRIEHYLNRSEPYLG